MEQELLNALDGFDAVWERVMNSHGMGEAPQAAPEKRCQELECLLQETATLWSNYRAMAGRTTGAPQKRFMALAEETQRSARGLQTEYFLRTGDIFQPDTVSDVQPGVLTGMRRAYETETRLSQNKGFPDLRQTAETHAGALRDMIAELLGS